MTGLRKCYNIHIHNEGCVYSAIRKNEILRFAGGHRVSEGSWAQKDKAACFLSYVEDRAKG
jgi:hypothetical protein